MGVDRRRKVRVTLFYLVLVSAFILISSLIVHKLTLEYISGREGIKGLFEFVVGAGIEIKGINAAILKSDYSANFFSEHREKYLALTMLWDKYLKKRGIKATIIPDEVLAGGLERYNLLILPATVCLSQPQIDAVKRFLKESKGLILTWVSGLRDENGMERSWSLSSDLTGSKMPAVLRDGEPLPLIVCGHSPLTANVSPGLRMGITTYDRPVGLEMFESRCREDAYWEDEIRLFSPLKHSPRSTAVLHGRYFGGRFAWFGFTIGSVVSKPADQLVFDRLLWNAISWVNYRSIVGKAAWPGGERAAAAFVVDLEKEIPSALDFANSIFRDGEKATFFISPKQALINKRIVDQIASGAELALKADNTVVPFQGQTLGNQQRRLKRAKAELEKAFRVNVSGFSPPGLLYDRATVEAISRLNMDYIWVKEGNRAAPEIERFKEFQPIFRRRKEPILFFENGRSDYNLIAQKGLQEKEEIYEMLKEDFDSIYRVGGLYSFRMCSHLLDSSQYRRAIFDLMDYIKTKPVWTASLSEIADWWRRYSKVEVSIKEQTLTRLTLMITNTGGERVHSIVLYVYPGIPPAELKIRAERIGTPIPEHRIEPRKNRIVLEVRNLRAGESRAYYLDILR